MVEDTKTNKILSNLPRFLDHSGNNRDFVTSYDEDFQDVSDNIILLKQSIQLSTATGDNLDDIAGLFRLVRSPGETDVSLRNRIKIFFSNENRGGTLTSIQNILVRALSLDTDDITITEPENLYLNVKIDISDDSEDEIINRIADVVNNAKPAGVYAEDISFDSQNDIFRTNFSEVNDDDTLL